MSESILRLENVSCSKAGKQLLGELSSEVFPGEAVLLTGPSGSGKSTLLRILSRFEDPSTGTVHYQGQPIQNWVPHQFRQEVTLVFQTPVFFQGTVIQNLQQIDQLHHRSLRSSNDYAAMLTRLGLAEAQLEQESTSLSLGEKQRLSVARAMLNQPRVLLLDEPLSALDTDSAQVLLTYLRECMLKDGLTLVMATHQEPDFPFFTQSWRMCNGELATERISP